MSSIVLPRGQTLGLTKRLSFWVVVVVAKQPRRWQLTIGETHQVGKGTRHVRREYHKKCQSEAFILEGRSREDC